MGEFGGVRSILVIHEMAWMLHSTGPSTWTLASSGRRGDGGGVGVLPSDGRQALNHNTQHSSPDPTVHFSTQLTGYLCLTPEMRIRFSTQSPLIPMQAWHGINDEASSILDLKGDLSKILSAANPDLNLNQSNIILEMERFELQNSSCCQSVLQDGDILSYAQ